MITDRDEDFEPQGDAKRRRAPTETLESKSDYYDEILEGHVNGVVRNSWLRVISRISSQGYFSERMEEGISPIKTLSRQLLLVKRRLWPAANLCAEASSFAPNVEFAEARCLCNPMEPLGEGRHQGLNHMFMNRSAIKLANIDAMLDFRLTEVRSDHFLFADLCGAPGGFSEYLMMRCQSTKSVGSCRGYGMSLVGANEHGNGTTWKLQHIFEQHGAFQTHYHISGGADDTGDLYRWENVSAFSNGIQDEIQSARLSTQKVHLVVADGGFDAQRDSECQEELAQKLILCEIAAGIYLLQQGGTLIVKMFGFQTTSVRSAMRSLYDYFEELVALKPISSRPASSERYVVCSGFRGVAHDWDGPRWINSVLLGMTGDQDETHYSRLDKYLDDVDRDILSLNLKACFSILTCLERKAAANCAWHEWKESWMPERPHVNVNIYKHAWRLH